MRCTARQNQEGRNNIHSFKQQTSVQSEVTKRICFFRSDTFGTVRPRRRALIGSLQFDSFFTVLLAAKCCIINSPNHPELSQKNAWIIKSVKLFLYTSKFMVLQEPYMNVSYEWVYVIYGSSLQPRKGKKKFRYDKNKNIHEITNQNWPF